MESLKRAAVLAALLAGCGSESVPGGPERDLRAEVQWARRTLDEVNTNNMAQLSFSSLMEQGATVLTYVAANLPDNHPTLPIHYEDSQPKRPWAVVVRNGSGAGEIIIEGYGEDLSMPICCEHVTIAAPSSRR